MSRDRDNKSKKWDEAYQVADIASATPASVLNNYSFLLPEGGDALDLACGRAGNALFLASLPDHDFMVDAVDYSHNVIDALTSYVNRQQLPINPILRDIEKDGLQQGGASYAGKKYKAAKKYDVITVSYFLNRSLFPQIINALKPDGLLFYQTWSQEKVDNSGPSNPDFRLKKGELLSLCTGMTPLLYKEFGNIGNIDQGLRNEALIIAKK